MTKKRLGAIALLWLVTVAVAASLTWAVISAAGARVGQPTRITVPPAATPGQSATASATPTGTAPAATAAWTGAAGRVTATCTADGISLANAVPADGFAVKVEDRGPKQVRVEFESKSGDDDDEVKLTATCEQGRPVFVRD